MEIDIQNELNNKNLEVEKEQKSFLETTLGGIINTGLNLGIKYLLPDFVEDEVIKIKDTSSSSSRIFSAVFMPSRCFIWISRRMIS